MFKVCISVFMILSLCGCASAPKVAVKNECGFTSGYAEEKLEIGKYKIILYTGINSSDTHTLKTLDYRASELCRSKAATYKMVWGLTYLDGCFKRGNSTGESHWQLSCLD